MQSHDVPRSDIVVRLTGRNRESVDKFIESLKASAGATKFDIRIEWGPSEHRDADICDAIIIAVARPGHSGRPEFREFPILVHDKSARGFEKLQLRENRRVIGLG